MGGRAPGAPPPRSANAVQSRTEYALEIHWYLYNRNNG